jgi:hypothetical protein
MNINKKRYKNKIKEKQENEFKMIVNMQYLSQSRQQQLQCDFSSSTLAARHTATPAPGQNVTKIHRGKRCVTYRLSFASNRESAANMVKQNRKAVLHRGAWCGSHAYRSSLIHAKLEGL